MSQIEHPIGREGYREGLRQLAVLLGYPTGPSSTLQTAFTHRSFANEVVPRQEHNERLEFLGDAVLDLVVAEALMLRFPLAPEGELHRLKTTLVCTTSLAERARTLSLGALLRLGKGELRGLGREKDSLLANAFEAMLGALYLDLGFEHARLTILQMLEAALSATQVGGHQGFDPKSRLQEFTQRAHGITPVYEVIDATGPEHEKEFKVAVLVKGKHVAVGVGRSKKAAERNAADRAIRALSSDVDAG
ncbi:MAG: ribonuclease III [Bradymonadia bacterium]